MGKMMKNTKRGIFILLVMLCIMVAFVIGCGEINIPDGSTGGGDGEVPVGPNPPVGNKPKLSAVVASSVVIEETAMTLVVTWDEVPNAKSYTVRVGKSTSSSTTSINVEEPSIDLREKGFNAPAGVTVIINITAKAPDYANSDITEITYEMEGTLLLSPEIVSFKNDVIEWKNDTTASGYTVRVNGNATQTQNNTYNVSSLTGKSTIEIWATINGKAGAITSVAYDATSKKLSVLPIRNYTVDGEILRWDEVGGAVGYKVVDLDFNAYTVTSPYYIMSIRNIVYGVYPVMSAKSVLESAEVEPVDIKYLEGDGTVQNPYIIKTPFDLRAIDYYELKAFEGGNTVKNNYLINNDINYNTVSALEADSNMFTLRKPFYGALDGGNHTLSNISVTYNYGFWAMFEFIAAGGSVKNIKFDTVRIINSVQDEKHPTNPSSAMVAYRNYGTVSEITLSNSGFNITGGSAAGIVVHNYGTVSGCAVRNCELVESNTSAMGTAAYEMAGVVLENYGTVNGNSVDKIKILGNSNNNIGTSAGIVAINRAGGVVKDNSYADVTIKNFRAGKEAGGVVGYCANGGTVTKGSGSLGTLIVGAQTIDNEMGAAGSTGYKGKLCGKKD